MTPKFYVTGFYVTAIATPSGHSRACPKLQIMISIPIAMHNGPRFFVSSSWHRPVNVISENIGGYKLESNYKT